MGNRNSTVTVVIPTFNRSAWLRDLLKLTLNQTKLPDVVLVADNGSTDETEVVMRDFLDDPAIRYLRRPSNIDPILNINEALAQVETDYVSIVYDDDRIYPDFLRATSEVLDARPAVGVVHTSFDVIDGEGSTIFPDLTLVESHGGTTVERGVDFIREHMINRWRVCFALSRTEALRNVGFLALSDRADWLNADMVMWTEAAVDWDIAHVASTLAAYRIHAETLTATRLAFTAQGYSSSRESADRYLTARKRFIDRRREELDNADELLRLAERAWRLDRIAYISQSTFPDRRRAAVVSQLWSTFRRDRRVAAEIAAWRLLGVSLAGRRIAARARGLRESRSGGDAAQAA